MLQNTPTRRSRSARPANAPTIMRSPWAKLTVSVAKIRPFIVTADWRPLALTDKADLRAWIAPKTEQLELFAA